MKAISIDLALVLTRGAVDEAFSVHDSGDIESATLALGCEVVNKESLVPC